VPKSKPVRTKLRPLRQDHAALIAEESGGGGLGAIPDGGHAPLRAPHLEAQITTLARRVSFRGKPGSGAGAERLFGIALQRPGYPERQRTAYDARRPVTPSRAPRRAGCHVETSR